MRCLYMRFPGGKPKAMTFSYDDGVETDERLIRIFDENGMAATFNVNTGCFAAEGTVYPPGTVHRRMSKSAALALYAGGRHEVAVHAAHHPFLDRLPAAAAVREVLADRIELEKMFSRTVRGMAYPFGTTSDEVVSALAACGIAYARTTVSTGRFDVPRDWLRLPATCHHDDPRLFELLERFRLPAQQARPAQLFYLWGHSYEFDQKGNWDRIEKFCGEAAGMEDTWYASNIEIYDYVEAYSRLRVGAEGTILENPASQALWCCDPRTGEVFDVAPGARRILPD